MILTVQIAVGVLLGNLLTTLTGYFVSKRNIKRHLREESIARELIEKLSARAEEVKKAEKTDQAPKAVGRGQYL